MTPTSNHLDDLGDILTLREVAGVLRRPMSGVYRIIREGKLEVLPVGRPYRVAKATIAKMLEVEA